MNGTTFYFQKSDGSTLLHDMLAEAQDIRKQLSEVDMIHKILGHLIAYSEKGCHCDGHLASLLRDPGIPPVKEFRIKIPGGDYLLRIVYISTESKDHYITSYFIKPSSYEKQKEKEINKLYTDHIKLARQLFKKKDQFIPLEEIIQGL